MQQFLSTGGTADPFLPHLLEAIRGADQIDLAVAFIKSSGLAMIYRALDDAIEIRGARLRVLTSDYLHVTDPQALRRLMLLAERGAEVRGKPGTDQEYSTGQFQGQFTYLTVPGQFRASSEDTVFFLGTVLDSV